MAKENSTHKPNRLIKETSPYLLQHAYNPVDWFSWGPEAFAKAKDQDKPIFLSIGYSTCHWCHVMEHESFEDTDVAKLMNETFISIKVDREERPDIDKIYMGISQMITGSGGWPLTIIMTPDKKPFFAGTYIPKQSRYGRRGLMDLIPQVQKLWSSDRQKILNSAEEITTAAIQSAEFDKGDTLRKPILDEAYHQLASSFDTRFGGFGGAPKFPTPHMLTFLLRYGHRTGNSNAIEMVEKTLSEMRKGGIFDHLGFGFHRYSTDTKWFLPHFEKMLYDQALLLIAYTELFLFTHKQEYAQVIHELITYITRDLLSPEGVFYSAEDADSEGEEGKFYTWTYKELNKILPAKILTDYSKIYNILPQGNYHEEATGQTTGKNILYLSNTLSEMAEILKQPVEKVVELTDKTRNTLLKIRNRRVRPMRDFKILTDWNGLIIAALAKAGSVLAKPEYLDIAKKAADFILTKMVDDQQILYHRYSKDQRAIPGFLDDYAFLSWGLFELYQATFVNRYLESANLLTNQMIQHFSDQTNGGFYFTRANSPDVIIRKKELYDGAIPSGNSVASLVLLKLGRVLANSTYEEYASNLSRQFSTIVKRMPRGFSYFLHSLEFALNTSFELVIVGKRSDPNTIKMINAYQQAYLPNIVVLFKDLEQKSSINELAPFTKDMNMVNDKPTAYVCKNYQCELPTTNIDKMLQLLKVETK